MMYSTSVSVEIFSETTLARLNEFNSPIRIPHVSASFLTVCFQPAASRWHWTHVLLFSSAVILAGTGAYFLYRSIYPSDCPTLSTAQFSPVLNRPNSFRSKDHMSELHSLMRISYAAFCLNTITLKSNDPPPH